MSGLRVLIVGAGLGGLTLARSLRTSGATVTVFERDASPWDRPQGYRLHLDADAINACRAVLPEDLRSVFAATARRTEPVTTVLAPDLTVVKRLPTADEHDPAVWPGHEAPGHANVDRATLRQILLHGVADAVHYGKTLDRYDSTADGVTARFTDGSSARGDVLVGADGVRSSVRRLRAPACVTVDAGVTAIYGRVPVAAAAPLVPAETLTDIFTIAADDRLVFLGLGSVRFPTPPEVAAKLVPGMAMRPQDDYVVCIVGGRHEFFPEVELAARAAAELPGIAAEVLRDWPDPARAVLHAADPSSFFPVVMRTSVPCALDAPTNVTLLGDAVHAMTPTLGRGANLAMRDAALLGRALGAVADGSVALGAALAAYEREMLDHGFAVVREAARIGEQRMGQNPLPGGQSVFG